MSTIDRARSDNDPAAEATGPGGGGTRAEPPAPAAAWKAPAAQWPPAKPDTESLEEWYFCGGGSTTRQP